jgi:hypothetical protein
MSNPAGILYARDESSPFIFTQKGVREEEGGTRPNYPHLIHVICGQDHPLPI